MTLRLCQLASFTICKYKNINTIF